MHLSAARLQRAAARPPTHRAPVAQRGSIAAPTCLRQAARRARPSVATAAIGDTTFWVSFGQASLLVGATMGATMFGAFLVGRAMDSDDPAMYEAEVLQDQPKRRRLTLEEAAQQLEQQQQAQQQQQQQERSQEQQPR